MTSGLSQLVDLWSESRATKKPITDRDMGNALLFIGISFVILFVVMSFHQDWEKQEESRGKRIRLGGICNGLGFLLMTAFLLVVKGLK